MLIVCIETELSSSSLTPCVDFVVIGGWATLRVERVMRTLLSRGVHCQYPQPTTMQRRSSTTPSRSRHSPLQPLNQTSLFLLLLLSSSGQSLPRPPLLITQRWLVLYQGVEASKVIPVYLLLLFHHRSPPQQTQFIPACW